MLQDDHRHFLKRELPRRKKATMAGDNPRLGVHQDRVVETDGGDTGPTCASEWVLGFRANGMSLSSGQCSMRCAIG